MSNTEILPALFTRVMKNHRLFSLLEYTLTMNATYGEQLLSLQKDIDRQVYSLYSHILTVQDLWNSRILGADYKYGVWELLTANEWKAINESNHQTTLAIIDENPLDKEIFYNNSSGKSFKNTIEEILYHVVNHSTHHRAQISLLLRQGNIEPIKSDYIFQIRNEL